MKENSCLLSLLLSFSLNRAYHCNVTVFAECTLIYSQTVSTINRNLRFINHYNTSGATQLIITISINQVSDNGLIGRRVNSCVTDM